MINLKPYEEYMSTGYEWLKEVPSHWSKMPIRSITELSNERNGQRTDLELLSVYREYGVIIKTSRDDNHNVESTDLSNYKYVDKEYLVLNKMKMWQGSLGVSKYEGIVSPAYIVCKLIGGANNNYINYLLRSAVYKTIYNQLSYGVRVGQWDMRYDDFKNIQIYLPPREEQDQIVRFLDSKLLKINKFIKNKKKLIELLKEKKQAVINQAVTKGLDPDAKMKPSGIEWLGDVPEGWSVCKLKNIGSFKSGINLTSLEINEKGMYPVYGGNGLRGFYDMSTHNGKYILIGRQGALCGNAHLVQGAFWATEHAIVVSNFDFIDINWAYYMFKVMNLNQYSQSAAQPGLSVEKIIKLPTIMPPIFEQKNIAAYIVMQLERVNKTINRITKEIELLTEYRTSLISAVVTGQVDVRDVHIEEPQEVLEEELEAIEEELPLEQEIPESEAI